MLTADSLLSRTRPCSDTTSMEQAPAYHRYLSDSFYRTMCTSNPGSKTHLLYHPSTLAGQRPPLPPLRAKKTSFRRVHTEGAGDCFVISLLNGRGGTEKFRFSDADIKETRDSIGQGIVEHTTVGHYANVEDMRADGDRPLKKFEAHRAVACGIKLTPRSTLHSLAQDIETQTMSLRYYLDIDSLGAATDALGLGLVTVWLQSPDDPDEYVVYCNHVKGRLHQIFRGQNTEGPVVNIFFHNATNPGDSDVYAWAGRLLGHTELLVPVDAGGEATSTLDDCDIAHHTKCVTSEFQRIIRDGLEYNPPLPRDEEEELSYFKTHFSKLPGVLQFKKEVSEILKKWVSDATPDFSAIRSSLVAGKCARGRSGPQDERYIDRAELMAMLAKQKKDIADILGIPTPSLDSATSTEGQGRGKPFSKDSSK